MNEIYSKNHASTVVDLHEFSKEIECVYDGERYSVRDNGAVLRHTQVGKRQRPTDAQWTFGKPNNKTGYMEIASVRVHRIVATAFHGNPPTPEYVVDHIDTNRRNNRPENLRWLTRLENALLNPITVKKNELICGSVEAFLADPSKLRSGSLQQNFEWMRTVSVQEAQASLERMHLWAKNKRLPSGGALGEWVFKAIPVLDAPSQILSEVPALVMAKTQNCAQRRWRIPSEFPCCPQEFVNDPITVYATSLQAGAIFARNELTESVVVKVAVAKDCGSFWVMCQCMKNAIKPWALAHVAFEKGLYIHTSLGTFFDKLGVEKQFCLAQGLEWTGGDSIDDYS